VTGPAGAGKTAVADAYTRTRWRARAPVPRRRPRPGQGRVRQPRDGWNDLTQRQYDLARRSCALTARLYAADGYACVIDDAIFPDWPQVGLDGWLSDSANLKVGLVVLTDAWRSSCDATRPQRHRNSTRHRPVIHDRMLAWREQGVPVVDTSD